MSNTAKNSAATPKTVAEGAEKQDVTVEAVAVDPKVEKTTKTVPSQSTGEKETPKDAEAKTEETEWKPSVVQRLKAVAVKLKRNKKAMLIIGGAVVVVGLTIKNNRKAVSVEPLDEAEGPVVGVDETVDPDETTDSL